MIYPYGYDILFVFLAEGEIYKKQERNGYYIMFAYSKYIMRRKPYIISHKRYIIFREGSNRAVCEANCNLSVNGCKARGRVGVTVTP